MSKLQYLAKSQRAIIDKSYFTDSDKLSRGLVDEQAFARVIRALYKIPIDDKELSALINKYAVTEQGFGPITTPSTERNGFGSSVMTSSNNIIKINNNSYLNKPRLVDYKSFISDMEVGLFDGNLTGLEKEPKRDIIPIMKPWQPDNENKGNLNNDEKSIILQVIDNLADVINSRSISLESGFTDRDPRR